MNLNREYLSSIYQRHEDILFQDLEQDGVYGVSEAVLTTLPDDAFARSCMGTHTGNRALVCLLIFLWYARTLCLFRASIRSDLRATLRSIRQIQQKAPQRPLPDPAAIEGHGGHPPRMARLTRPASVSIFRRLNFHSDRVI